MLRELLWPLESGVRPTKLYQRVCSALEQLQSGDQHCHESIGGLNEVSSWRCAGHTTIRCGLEAGHDNMQCQRANLAVLACDFNV
jgi:hypothetical protein